MRALFRWAVVLGVGVLGVTQLTAQSQPRTLDELLQQVRQERSRASAENQARVDQFRAARDQQRALANDAKQKLQAEETRSTQLKSRFDKNEIELSEMEETLRIRVGDMGELFGVVRQVAGDVRGTVENSLVSAQYEGRLELLTKLAAAKELPSIEDLDQLRITMQEEMTESGKVVRFPGKIVRATGEEVEGEVVRVGVFNLISEDRFLKYEPSNNTIQELARQPAGRFRADAGNLFSAQSGIHAMAVDPTYGALLGLLIQSPDLRERVDQGGVIGYVIIALGLVGLLIAVWRFLYLTVAGARIRSQLKQSAPDTGNALGRILSVYSENKDADTETLELKLDEAIMKETPRLEKWQGGVKVIAAVAPLLGLLGTVTGMIQTFQSITLFGTGDPKLMAGGISQALMTTVLGLVVAIPMVLLYSILAGRSKGLIEILEEQSAGIIAAQSEREL